MTTTTKTLKTWIDGEFVIRKHRDEDGDIRYELTDEGEFIDDCDTLDDAREYIRDRKNNATVDEIHELLGDLDLADKATAKKLAAIIAYLKK